MGEGFGLLIHMYPHSVQAGLISMKPEPITTVLNNFIENLIYTKQSAELILVYPTLQQRIIR